MRVWLWFVLLAIAAAAHAAAPAAGQHVTAQGAPDGAVPGWAISTAAPVGWTADCCTYAKAIGVNFVLYQGDWTGEPERVMVLNVWPRKLSTLADEWQADQKHFLQRDPLAKVSMFPLVHPLMPCHGLLYQGTDHIDDMVVFCDPGKASGIRLSWSMAVADDDARRPRVTALFQQVIEQSLYAKYRQATPPTPKAGQH